MQLIVDRSTVAMDAEVCSLYLVDRDGAGLTLAATNGVDREHIGVARLDIGQGITGLAASTRGPVVSTDLANDPRCAWIRGVDHERFTSILAVPLEVGDRVVGVLNVKTEERRDFDPAQIRRLSTIASLLAGVVERRRLHLETEAQLDGLRSVDQARAELIAVVTHQLRTPLAVVRAYLDLLAETAQGGSDEVATWHDAATGQLLRLNDLVDTILDTVRADRLLTVEQRRFEVGIVIDEVLTRLAPLLRRHRLERYARDSRPALGDPARLAQVLELLLENAAKYAPPGAEIVVADWSADGEVHVAVGDDGPGVPPTDARERLRALRAPRRRDRQAGDRCRPLRRAPAGGRHGRPAVDRGQAGRRQPVRDRAPGGAATVSLRILVIDDEPAMIGAVAALVGSVGHRVSAAYDGHEALRRYDAESPDLVILDLAMPGLDGVAVCREIRRRGPTPIIILSGEGDEAAKVEALDAGADDYVTKPFGKDELLARIRAVTRRRPAAAGASVGLRADRPAPARGVGRRPPAAADADRVLAARGARRRARRPRHARGAAARRMGRRARPGPAVDQAAPRPAAVEASRGRCGRPDPGARPRLPAHRATARGSTDAGVSLTIGSTTANRPRHAVQSCRIVAASVLPSAEWAASSSRSDRSSSSNDRAIDARIEPIEVGVEQEGSPAGHAGPEVGTDRSEHDHRPAGHVLAAMGADALDHRPRPGVADREAHPGAAHQVERPAGRPEQADVAGHRLVLLSRIRGRTTTVAPDSPLPT